MFKFTRLLAFVVVVLAPIFGSAPALGADFDRRLRLEFNGSRIISDIGSLRMQKRLEPK